MSHFDKKFPFKNLFIDGTIFQMTDEKQLYAASSLYWMAHGLDADAKSKEKKTRIPSGIKYKSSVSMLASDIGTIIGKN